MKNFSGNRARKNLSRIAAAVIARDDEKQHNHKQFVNQENGRELWRIPALGREGCQVNAAAQNTKQQTAGESGSDELLSLLYTGRSDVHERVNRQERMIGFMLTARGAFVGGYQDIKKTDHLFQNERSDYAV